MGGWEALPLFDMNEFPHARKENIEQKSIPSLIRWTGSKRSQASQIASYVPLYNRYFEPFLGGGALLYLLGKPNSVGGDIYKPLIDFWKLARDNPDKLITNYNLQWENLQNNLPDYYYDVRARFNTSPTPEDLCFLTRTCVNGIIRFNKSGNFNSSFHLTRPGMNPETFRKIVHQWSNRIQDIEFRAGEFQETTIDAEKGDFIYLDPPYQGSVQRYIANLNFQHFCDILENFNYREIKWAVSFDGSRGDKIYDFAIPGSLWRQKIPISGGQSALMKVLRKGRVETVTENLYLNYNP